jgi:V/A-type H+-transporting ATPase subunit F
MKFYLISDDRDTLTGMHLAGIEGEFVENYEAAQDALKKAVRLDDVGIILITDRIAENCEAVVSDIKINCKTPLLVEIPNSDGSDRPADSIMKIVHNAIGV